MATKRVRRKPKAFKYKGRTAFGVKNHSALLRALKASEKLSSYEQAILRNYSQLGDFGPLGK